MNCKKNILNKPWSYSSFLAMLILFAGSVKAQFSIDPFFAESGEFSDNDVVDEGPFQMKGVRVLPDSKLIVFGDKKLTVSLSGQNDLMLVKLTEDGTLDTSFADNGIFRLDVDGNFDRVEDVELLPDGKILVAGATSVGGNFHGYVIRLNADGSLDETFQSDGIRIIPRLTGGQESVNDILVSGENIYLAYMKGNATYPARQYAVLGKMTLDGALDETFGSEGFVELPNESEDNTHSDFKLMLTTNNKLIASYAIPLQTIATVWCLETDGTINTDFANDGKFEIEGYHTRLNVRERFDGKYIVLTYIDSATEPFQGIQVNCLNEDGEPNLAFGEEGIFRSSLGLANSLYINSDNTVLLAGSIDAEAALFKLTEEGTFDLTFASEGVQTIPQSPITYINPGNLTDVNVYAITDSLSFTVSEGFLTNYFLIRLIDNALPSSISDSLYEMNVLCYPNPTSGQLTIEVQNTIPTMIEIYDSFGRQVLRSSFSERIDISYLPRGIYILKLKSESEYYYSKRLVRN